MIRAITVAHKCGSGGTEVARLVAQKLGWELVDRRLMELVARLVGLDPATVAGFDEQAARWSGILEARGIVLREICPPAAPRWFDQLDDKCMHELATQLMRAAADFGECVIAAPGAQCLLQTRVDVFHVLAHASMEDRAKRVQHRYPECADVRTLLRQTDAQTAKYILEYYGSDWLETGLYDLCANTSMGLERAATLVNDAVVFPDTSFTATAEEEICLCYSLNQL